MNKKNNLIVLCLLTIVLGVNITSCASYLAELDHLHEVGMEAYQVEENEIKKSNSDIRNNDFESVIAGTYLMKEYLRDDKSPLNLGAKNSQLVMVDSTNSAVNRIYLEDAVGSPGYFIIKAVGSDLVWTVKDSSIEDGTHIILAPLINSNNQKFLFADGGSDNLYYIKSKESGKLVYSSNGELIIKSFGAENTRYMFKWELIKE